MPFAEHLAPLRCRVVKPPPFTYHRPTTRGEVDSILAEFGEEAKVLAGGQSLVPILNMRLVSPAHLVDINRLTGEPTQPLRDGDKLVIGPLVRHAALESSALVAEHAPLLLETVQYVAHPAIRNRGTVVGSIAHADPAAELPAALAALAGEAHVRSDTGVRTIPATELFTSQLETSLKPGEWIEQAVFPTTTAGSGHAVEEFARRHGDYAICGVIALAERAERDKLALALAFISMADVPRRIELPPLSVEEIEGQELRRVIDSAVREHLDPAADLHASVEYRAELARRLGARAARRAARMAIEED